MSRPETYREQFARKKNDLPDPRIVEANAAAEASPTRRAAGRILLIALLADGIAFWVVFGLALFGVVGWGVLLWPIFIASTAVILTFALAIVLGLWHGINASK